MKTERRFLNQSEIVLMYYFFKHGLKQVKAAEFFNIGRPATNYHYKAFKAQGVPVQPLHGVTAEEIINKEGLHFIEQNLPNTT